MTYAYTINNKQTQNIIQFLDKIQNNFSILKEGKQTGICHYYDTFDWRLYLQGYHLYLLNNTLTLYHHQEKKVEYTQELSSTTYENFVLPKGIIKNKVNPIIGIRSVLGVATLRITLQTFRILNRHQKTIARIQFEQSKIKEGSKYRALFSIINIQPIRGYANQVPGILEKLSSFNLSLCKEDRLKRGLSTIGKIPASYSSKFNVKLTKQMSGAAAAKKIYIYLLNNIQYNEFGIIQDIDIEFLHDFRVSIRRTRSALGQIKGIIDEKTVLRAKENFSFLGKSTNKLRDIDIYLLREKHYKHMLPVKLREFLNPYFENLYEERKTEHKQLVTILRSAKYKRIVSDWKRYLNSINENQRTGPSAEELAKMIILKRNKKVIKFGEKILLTGSDDLLHKLRIEGKKLRYLLEFFSSLFVQEKIQVLISKLKILQDNLGEFNDLVVQQDHLYTAVNEVVPRSNKAKYYLLALGILIGKLHEKQKLVKKEFAISFSSYADKKVQKIFIELFQGQGRLVK